MSDQETLARLWEEHVRYEFETKNTDDTIATMVEDAYVNHVPVMTGGFGSFIRRISSRKCRPIWR